MFLFMVLLGCYYDVEEELYLNIGCDMLDVGYVMIIVLIIEDNCMNCYNVVVNFGNVILEGYNNFKIYVDNG